MRKLKIGIVGCGAIGSSLAKTAGRDLSKRAGIAALYDADLSRARSLSKALNKNTTLAVDRLDKLIGRSDLVIEAASAKASAQIAFAALNAGRDIMVMSVGGLLGAMPRLAALAQRKGARIFIPSGAISGVDALKASAAGALRKVTLTTRKNPASLGLGRLKADKVIFDGPASQAVKSFPQNINVAAVLSLAGLGAQRTMVRIVASPKVHRNIHEIQIESDAGRVFTRTENLLHPDNPKTSYLAVLSAAAMLREILGPVRVGT